MEYVEFSGKTIDDAITEAAIKLGTTSDKLDFDIIEKGSSGILGIFNSKPAKIRVKKKMSIEDTVNDFLTKVFDAMELLVKINVEIDNDDKVINVNLIGNDMGVLIGKRGQTLDSLQYLVSLVINKECESYYRVKLDTENYRERRKETLENLAKNIAYKVKRSKRTVTLEPMNPYERRVIHSVLQNDKYVTTRSEGEEPFRRVIVTLKK